MRIETETKPPRQPDLVIVQEGEIFDDEMQAGSWFLQQAEKIMRERPGSELTVTSRLNFGDNDYSGSFSVATSKLSKTERLFHFFKHVYPWRNRA